MHKIKELNSEKNGDTGRFGDELSELLGRRVAISYIPDGKGGADVIVHDRDDKGRDITNEVDAADILAVDTEHRKEKSARRPLPPRKTVFKARKTKADLKAQVAAATNLDEIKAALNEVLEGLPN